jgi:hypothetical protein
MMGVEGPQRPVSSAQRYLPKPLEHVVSFASVIDILFQNEWWYQLLRRTSRIESMTVRCVRRNKAEHTEGMTGRMDGPLSEASHAVGLESALVRKLTIGARMANAV